MTVTLIVLDGWGIRADKNLNAIKSTKTPTLTSLWNNNPHCTLQAAGTAVGLPPNVMGNSEVGHLNLGAGRVVKQDATIIDEAIHSKKFYKNKSILSAIRHCKKNKSILHLIGLCSDAYVHSHLNHLIALVKLARKHSINTNIHFIADGMLLFL